MATAITSCFGQLSITSTVRSINSN